MATKIGDLFFDVYADVSRAVKNVDDFAGRVTSAGTAAARAIGETIANAVGIAVGATALLTSATLGAGVAYNTLGQSATAAFSSIYQDLNDAQAILSDISTLDLETPFRGSALTATARTLAGFGFEMENVVSTTEALAQATAAMGLGSDALHRMAIAFGQIQSRGKLAGDEARQLANYGIDAYGLLADQLGLTVAAVRELGQEGKLTADFVIPALVKSIETRFAGATDALFNTAAGQAEGLRSIFEGVGSALVQPFIGFSSGGAVVEGMNLVRESLVNVVSVAEDGSFVLQGFLAPLAPIVNDLADGFLSLAERFAGFISNLDAADLQGFIDSLEGVGPVVAGLGAGLLTIFAQAIPFVGRFVAGFNPVVVALTALALTSDTIREALSSAFSRIWEAAQPLIPGVKELVGAILGLAEEAVPQVLDAVASAFEALAPALQSTVELANQLLQDFGPTLVDVIVVLSEAVKVLAAVFGVLPPDLVAASAALYGLTVLFPITTAGLVAMTSATGLSGGAAALAATQFGMLATAIGIAAAAIASYNAISAGVTGDFDYLNRDVPFYEKPFQLAGRFGYALGGGDRSMDAATAEQNRLLEEGQKAGEAYARTLEDSGMSMREFSEAARDNLPTIEAVNYANIAYREHLDEIQQAHVEAARAIGATAGANLFEARVAQAAAAANGELTDSLAEEIKYLEILKGVAADAWEEVDNLSRAGADSVVDEFLAGLVDSAQELTEALAEPAGALRDLAVNNALSGVSQDALKVVNLLSREYGMSMDEIISYFDERGLAGVIDALGQVTEQTAQTVDPLVAKYSELGATAEQLRDAVSRLDEQRTSALEAQIDAVTDSLDRAREAADAAREAFDEYFQAGAGGLQGAIDKLVLDIPSIGDQIEEGLLRGGPQGEAAVRQALGEVGTSLGSIFQLGLEQGLSAEQIIAMLGPVYGSIEQEISGALDRISSLDWAAGFTPAAADEIRSMLAGILDPAQIDSLFSGITGADSTVASLERQLEDLQAQLQVDVEFTPEQVQAAIAEIQAEVSTTAVITPEAAQLVFEEIQAVFDDTDLKAAVDKAVITQDILDAAQEAEDQINLYFKSGLTFDSGELDEIARQVSREFYAAFTAELQQLRDLLAQQQGFDSYSAMVSALGPAVTAATLGTSTTLNQVINNDITVQGTPDPIATATETIAAGAAAAGGGGALDPSRYFRGTQPGGAQ